MFNGLYFFAYGYFARWFFLSGFESFDVPEGPPKHVVKLRLFGFITCDFCRSFRFRHGSTHLTHMARLK